MYNYNTLSEDELILKINHFAKKAKEEGLSEFEVTMRQELRKEYIKRIRKSVKSQLDNIEFI